jgi:hypothetical protein
VSRDELILALELYVRPEGRFDRFPITGGHGALSYPKSVDQRGPANAGLIIGTRPEFG